MIFLIGLFWFFSRNTQKIVDDSAILTRIFWAEGKHTDHLTNTTASDVFLSIHVITRSAIGQRLCYIV